MNTEDPLAAPVRWLYPTVESPSMPLRGLYLNIDPSLPGAGPDGALVYANFVSSLDGRIAAEGEARTRVPAEVANPRDWRLFQELAAHSDCLLTSGRYLRELEQGTAQDALPIGGAFTDLHQWRADLGFAGQPDVAVLSTDGRFRVPGGLLEQGRTVWALLPESTPPERCRSLEIQGARILHQPAGSARLRGSWIRDRLTTGLGYRRIYSAGGPQVVHTLLADGVLDSLYLTTRHRAIGGRAYESWVEGERLRPAFSGILRWMILDEATGDGAGQHFQRFDRA